MAYQELSRTNPPTTAIGGHPHEVGVFPLDIHNAVLLDHVSPMDWKNPEPADGFVYDLVAIGAGAGGLVTSEETNARGFKAALIEKHMNGGDCLNIGCVPSKALLRSAKAIKETRNCAGLGVEATFQGVNFGKIMERMRARRAEIAPVDSGPGAQARGTDMYFGEARFTGRNELSVNGKTLRFRKAVIATGGSAYVPPIPGLKDTPFLTNASLYNLTELPKRMLVVGAGPIGCEMAQAFAIFGSQVTMVADTFLPREDPAASAIVKEALHKDGVQFDVPCKITKVQYSEGVFRVFTSTRSEPHEAETLLVATGRKPNVDCDFEKAGVQFDVRTGVHVNDYLQTSNPDIYSVGDCATRFNFTHVAAHMAGMAVENALFGGKRAMLNLLIPWVTYTFPEIAHVGKYEQEVPEGVDIYESPFEENDRAILEDAKEGFVKLLCTKGTDRIVGATIVGEHAGEMLHELSVCIQFGISIGALASVIHSYPTLSSAVEGAANKYRTSHWRKAADLPHVASKSEVETAAATVRSLKEANAHPDAVKKAVDEYLALKANANANESADATREASAAAEAKVNSAPAVDAAAKNVRALKKAGATEAEVKAAVEEYRLVLAAERVRVAKTAGASVEEVKVAVDAYIAVSNEVNRAKPAPVAATSQETNPAVVSSPPATIEEAATRVRHLKAIGAPQAEVKEAVDAYNAFKPAPVVHAVSASPSAHSALKAAADKVRSLKAAGAPTEEVKAAVDAYVALSDAGEAKTAAVETPAAESVASIAETAPPARSEAAEKVRALKSAGAPQAEVEAAVRLYHIEQAAERVRTLKANGAPQDEVRAACLAYENLTKPAETPQPNPQTPEEAKVELGPFKSDLDIARDRVRTLKADGAPKADVEAAVRVYLVEEAKDNVRSLKAKNATVEEVKAAVAAYIALVEPSAAAVSETSNTPTVPATIEEPSPTKSEQEAQAPSQAGSTESSSDEAPAVRLHMPETENNE